MKINLVLGFVHDVRASRRKAIGNHFEKEAHEHADIFKLKYATHFDFRQLCILCCGLCTTNISLQVNNFFSSEWFAAIQKIKSIY